MFFREYWTEMGKLLILKYAEIDSKRLKYRTELHQSYALVKLFCPHPPSRGSPGLRGKMLVIKKGGALEKIVIRVFI